MKPLTRRTMLGAGGVAAVGPLTALFPGLAFGQAADSLTIAYNVALPRGDPTSRPSPVGAISWSSVANLKADGNKITGDGKQFVADLFKWMAFLTGYAIPQQHYEKVGAAGFEKQPIGSGPYVVDEFVAGSYVKLKAFDKYWGPKPVFRNV